MKPGSRRRAYAGLMALVSSALAVSLTSLPSSAVEDVDAVPGTRPAGEAARSVAAAALDEDATDGLQMVVNERGRISQSTSALGTNSEVGSLRVRKPAGATVRGAWMAYATRGFSGMQVIAPLLLADQAVPITNELLNGIESYNYFADVTDIVKPIVDGAEAGDLTIPVAEPDPYYVEGEILVVVFDDPAVEQDQSVTLLYGALAPGGDRYRVGLSEPIDLADPATKLEMSLGITYSYQRFGTPQYSSVDVNQQPMTTAAGGEDDGQSSNGALITVGGLGDSTDNPVDPGAYPTGPRSDDELYDLRPFVHNGDRKIQVTTYNPSYDDNVMLATFTMNPPVTKIVSDKEQLVMLSFGDSYQSGEGAGQAYDDAVDYYHFAYENGENYPQRIGGQEDTLTPEATSGAGNACHRALRNYPKLVADRLTGENDVLHLDMTCSGAKVEPGGKPPIIGTVSGGLIDPNSQVYESLTRLSTVGVAPEDVDVVTVGMGGNDAKFSDLVTACLIPTLSRELLSRYERTPGLATWLANRLSCHRLDLLKFHVSDAIDALAEKQRFAQEKLRATFPNADIVQVDYPGILPDSDDAPDWCGGIGAGDIDYADTMAGRINDVIRDTVADARADSAALDRRYELVEVAGAFGSNGLCPGDPSEAYANGISQANFDTEVDRLLFDPVIRPLLDGTIDGYNDYMDCVRRWTLFCDPQEPLDRFIDNAQGLVDALSNEADSILPNIVKPPSSGEPLAVRFDRVNGLFHPNAAGIEVLSCYVYNTVAFLGTSFCPHGEAGRTSLSAPARRASVLVDDEAPSRAPIPVTGPGDTLDVVIRGFLPGSQVGVRWGAEDLDPITVGEDGRVNTTLTLPAGSPGVHVLALRGEGAAGVGYGRDIRVEYPGRPVGGEDFATYLTGFEPRPSYIESDYEAEDIEVSYLGRVLYLAQADADGGLLVEVPVPFLRSTTEKTEIVARGLRSGIVRRVDLDPAPYAPALWSTAGPVSLSGTGASVDGYVHSESDLVVSGGGARLTGGVERVGRLLVSGVPVSIDPAATVTAAGSRFRAARVAAFRPGGTQAVAAGAAYRALPASACVDGVWKPRAADLVGVVYVPCSVQVSGIGLDRTVTIAAEGGISTAGSDLTLRPAGPGGATLVSGGSVTVAGAGTRLMGAVFAPDGNAVISGSDARVWCGVTAASIRVSGARFSASVDGRCLPD